MAANDRFYEQRRQLENTVKKTLLLQEKAGIPNQIDSKSLDNLRMILDKLWSMDSDTLQKSVEYTKNTLSRITLQQQPKLVQIMQKTCLPITMQLGNTCQNLRNLVHYPEQLQSITSGNPLCPIYHPLQKRKKIYTKTRDRHQDLLPLIFQIVVRSLICTCRIYVHWYIYRWLSFLICCLIVILLHLLKVHGTS